MKPDADISVIRLPLWVKPKIEYHCLKPYIDLRNYTFFARVFLQSKRCKQFFAR